VKNNALNCVTSLQYSKEMFKTINNHIWSEINFSEVVTCVAESKALKRIESEVSEMA
jgi:hypothetical protein